MGMGDKEEHYHPTYRKALDMVLNRYYADCSIRECPHPKVIERYGTGGVATVSIYTCKKCKFAERARYFDGYGCGYKLETGVPSAEKSKA